MSLVTPERQVAFDVLRRTFEREEHTEVAFREEAAARELTGRNRAQAQRLSYGAVQRRGTSDWVISSFMKQKSRRPDPAVAAALRLGIFELLFSDGTPDHAAVDQAVSLVRAAGADHAAGFANALLRRTLRERDSLTEKLADDSTPGKAAIAHSIPDWLARLWWEELGPDRARALMAASNRPSERAVRVNTARTTVEEAI
ncbi:MAG TPA: transcription antitermination factor NusB, partial [Solirubrobacterales bacterium]|nr:transcription antitermination factor NusB [Solirubrobacterales bacterium]